MSFFDNSLSSLNFFFLLSSNYLRVFPPGLPVEISLAIFLYMFKKGPDVEKLCGNFLKQLNLTSFVQCENFSQQSNSKHCA